MCHGRRLGNGSGITHLLFERIQYIHLYAVMKHSRDMRFERGFAITRFAIARQRHVTVSGHKDLVHGDFALAFKAFECDLMPVGSHGKFSRIWDYRNTLRRETRRMEKGECSEDR